MIPIKIAKCSKTYFPDKEAALSEIKIRVAQQIHFTKRQKNKKSNLKLRCYQCPRCGKWHLTTQKQKRKY